MTNSRISFWLSADSRTRTQWYRSSDGIGIRNLSGSDATSASRSSFGKANPISVSSRENATYTSPRTRNFTRSRTSASSVRGRDSANRRTSSTVTMAIPS
jgi:hypothetical protein